MNVYTKSKEVREELNKRTPGDVVFVEDIKEASVVVSGNLTKDDIHKSIKALIIPYVGYNQVDLRLLEAYDVALFNTQVNGVFVAERALGLCLSLMGKIVTDHQHIKQNVWSSYEGDSAWVSLRGKKVGLLGYGVIGQAIHQMVKPFETTVYTIDRNKDYKDCLLVDSLDALVEEVDVLFVQVPLTEETDNLIDETLLRKMQGKYLINVGRGSVINEDGLYACLKDGILKGFASDVWFLYPKKRTVEHAPSNYPICEMNNVVCTSHSAGNVTGIDALTYDDVARKIIEIKEENFKGQLNERG